MNDVLAQLLGAPVEVHDLKHKPGRRRTSRATGARGSAIVKQYESRRATTVAARLACIANGPRSPIVPTVLHVDDGARLLVLSEVPGEPLRHAVLRADTETCWRAGAALGQWHRAWSSTRPLALSDHTAADELDALQRQAHGAPEPIARVALERARSLVEPWAPSTVVHRDLYEEQVVVAADGSIGLIDLDDMALGPPELDVGNLVAHLDLLGHRRAQSLDGVTGALLDGYGALDAALLDRCRRLTLLRLACIHAEPALLRLEATAPPLTRPAAAPPS